MKNEDFYILHLSDLHLKNQNGSYSKSLKNLIKDIFAQIQDKQNVIMVITGDLIDQGNYKKNENVAKKFFQDLKERLGDKIYDIVIVPGNHDKKRSPINSLISMSHSEVGLSYDSASIKEEWKVQLEAYSDFFKLANYVYGLFGKKYFNKNTFGIKKVEINNIKICFVCLDTAWCSYSKNDYRKLRVGSYQLKCLCDKYTSISNEQEGEATEIDLTIALSHHPLNWLEESEEKLCNDYFMSEDHLNVDILMCGHVHNFSVVNHFNHNHSLLTLVTGIGWGEDVPNEDKKDHRYSLYSLNIFCNSCDVVMRKTKQNLEFDYDYSVYAQESEIRDNKLRYPLKVKESSAFIRVNAPTPIETKSLFIENKLLSYIPCVSKTISLFCTNISGIQHKYKRDFIQTVVERKLAPEFLENEEQRDEFGYEETLTKIQNYFYNSLELNTEFKKQWLDIGEEKHMIFASFLTEICTSIVEEFKDCFSDEVKIRAHFRWNDLESADTFPQLCQFSNIPEEGQEEIRTVTWDSLIKAAFDTGEPVVYSLNKKINPLNTSWDDFITIIPRFNNYAQDIRVSKKNNVRRPILTFGISIKDIQERKDIIVLYLLAYLRIDDILTNIIDEFIRVFDIEVKDFLVQIQKTRNNIA